MNGLRLYFGAFALTTLSFTMASAADREVVWSQRTENKEQAQRAQQELILTLFNTGRLPFKSIPMGDRATLEQVMREEGAWVGPMTEPVASMLCAMNPKHCNQKNRTVAAETLSNPSAHVGGTLGFDLDWTADALDTVSIPDLRIVQVWKPEPARKGSTVAANGIKVNRNCLTSEVCIDDYVPASGFEQQIGRFRGKTVATPDRKGKGPVLELIPHLNAIIVVSEAPLESYETIQARWAGFEFKDSDFKKFDQSLSERIIGSVQVRLENDQNGDAFSGLLNEPLSQHQEPVIASFCNKPVYGECPEIDTDGMISMSVAVVDQLPLVNNLPHLSHCDLGEVSVLGLANREITLHNEANNGAKAPCNNVLDTELLPEHHGIHVLGLLAAKQNQRGISGLLSGVPNLKYIFIPFDSVLAKRGDIRFALDLSQAITHAVTIHGVRVFNLSFSYQLPAGGSKDVILDTIRRWEDLALFVVAGGKDGDDANNGVCDTRPACYAESVPNILSVVGLETDPNAIDLLKKEGSQDELRTNFGDKNFMLGAPARNIVSTVGDIFFGPATGTSQAAPQVTAAATLLMMRHALTPSDTRDRLIYTSRLSLGAAEKIAGGAPDATTALMKDVDHVWLKGGCRLTGVVLDLRREISGEMNAGSFDLTYLTRQKLSRPLSAMRRMHWNGNKGIFFFELNGQLDRAVATFTTQPEQHVLRIDLKSTSENCDPNFAVGDLVEVRLSETKDFISQLK